MVSSEARGKRGQEVTIIEVGGKPDELTMRVGEGGFASRLEWKDELACNPVYEANGDGNMLVNFSFFFVVTAPLSKKGFAGRKLEMNAATADYQVPRDSLGQPRKWDVDLKWTGQERTNQGRTVQVGLSRAYVLSR
jgi:hypothetical protein